MKDSSILGSILSLGAVQADEAGFGSRFSFSVYRWRVARFVDRWFWGRGGLEIEDLVEGFYLEVFWRGHQGYPLLYYCCNCKPPANSVQRAALFGVFFEARVVQ